MINAQKKLDLEFGSDDENGILLTLRKFFNDDSITKTKNINASFDFEGKNILIELKSRRCKSSTYPTTIVGSTKFKKLDPDKTDHYFVFKFTDGTFYIKYNPGIFRHYEEKSICRRDRGRIEKQTHILIPVDNLQPLVIDEETNKETNDEIVF